MTAVRLAASLLFTVGAALSCGDDGPPRPLVLASTTSTDDSGLFDELIPAFERAYPDQDVKVVAVGTGQALELGRRRDADVLLVHAPDAESAFVASGHGLERREVMYNDFVLVGPPEDPALTRGRLATAALRRIADTRAPFVSRGDDSGTHRRERALWREASLEPRQPGDPWYLEAGHGMGEVLQIASEKRAYTLADRATYLSLRRALALAVLVEGDPRLFNQYGVIPVAGAMNPVGARAFTDWITGPEGQAVIERYGADRFGRALFVPNARRAGHGGLAGHDSTTAQARNGER